MSSPSSASIAPSARNGFRLGVPAPLLCLVSMLVVQLGVALSRPLFGPLGVRGVTSVRLAFAGVLLLGATRPRLRGRSARDLGAVALLGVASGAMALLYAAAIDRIPMGAAATIEFLGPLSVALALSRRLLDVVWAGLAAGGVVLLALIGQGAGGEALDPVGLAFAFAAAACFALYIVLTPRVGRVFEGFQGLALSISVGAVVMVPFGIAPAAHGLATEPSPGLLLAAGCGLGLLFPVVPYALEMAALRRMPPKVFSVLVSLEPGISACVGVVVLRQMLGLAELAGIACVVVASMGATFTARG
jgi:inner membrane transporter RhtA